MRVRGVEREPGGQDEHEAGLRREHGGHGEHDAELWQRREWLETSSELTRRLLSGEDVDDVLAAFAQRMRRFAAADLVLVAVAEAGGIGMLIVAADGGGAGRLRGTVVGIDGTLLGHVHKSGGRVIVADLSQDERADRETCAALGVGPGLVVPLAVGGQSRGAVSLSRGVGTAPFDEELADLAAELTVQAAVVLELAERRRDSELLSLYADRDRIGRDLHDLAIQRLFAASMSLQSAHKLADNPAVAHRIAAAVSDLDETVKVIRSTIFALHAHERVRPGPGAGKPCRSDGLSGRPHVR